MHREDESRYLLFIQPKNSCSQPIDDSLTKVMQKILSAAKRGTSNYSDLNDDGQHFKEGGGWKGWHTCICGEASDNADYLLPNGMITNSLCIHYLKYHRRQIPKTQLIKLQQLLNHYRNNKQQYAPQVKSPYKKGK